MKPNIKCQICGRDASTAEAEPIDSNIWFCCYHQRAYENLKTGFEKWCQAYGETSWKNYLQLISELSETGAWAKECCEHLLLREKKN